MPKVKTETAGKIGLFSAIMVIFGAVVGIGIFFKNYSVFRLNGGNSVGVLISWIVAIIMVLCIALSYGEIVTCKTKKQGDGLGGWATRFCGYNFGRFTKLMYTGVYYPVLTFAILFFTGEACLNCFASYPGFVDFGKGTVLYVFLIGAAFFALFIFLNYFVSKAMGKFSNVTGIIKFIPIAVVILLGIIFGAINGGGLWTGTWISWDPTGQTLIPQTIGNLSVEGIISSIPAILFAFEGYLVIGNIAGDMEKPEKNVPLAIVLAIVIISALNIAITIGCMTAGTGNVYHLMYIVCGLGHVDLALILNIVMSVFIFICIIGVLNAMVFSGMRAFQGMCADGTLFKGKQLADKKPNKLYAGAVFFSAMIGFWWLGIAIPSCILNTDAIADGSSVVLIVVIYLIYGTVLLFGFINRFTKKVEVKKFKLFPGTSIIGAISCYFVFAFSGLYKGLIYPAMNPTAQSGSSWGLFVQDATGKPLPNVLNEWWYYNAQQHGVGHLWLEWETCLVFWIIAIVMIALPFINDLLIHTKDKNYGEALIWQKQRKDNVQITQAVPATVVTSTSESAPESHEQASTN